MKHRYHFTMTAALIAFLRRYAGDYTRVCRYLACTYFHPVTEGGYAFACVRLSEYLSVCLSVRKITQKVMK